MATLIIKDKHSGKLVLPHYVLINDQVVGMMKVEASVTLFLTMNTMIKLKVYGCKHHDA